MKILCLQLARLGDILNTRPVLNAILRKFPHAQVDLLVRERYSPATLGIDPRVKIKIFPSASFLAGIANDDVSSSLKEINDFTSSLLSEEYDTIINWSFSNLSSYVVSVFESVNESAARSIDVRGYSRFPDKSLKICDPVSGYFFAQVGIGRSNRVHLIDLFAGVAGVDLHPTDWCQMQERSTRHGVVIHVGASQEHKRVSATQFRLIIRRLLDETNHDVTLIGSS